MEDLTSEDLLEDNTRVGPDFHNPLEGRISLSEEPDIAIKYNTRFRGAKHVKVSELNIKTPPFSNPVSHKNSILKKIQIMTSKLISTLIFYELRKNLLSMHESEQYYIIITSVISIFVIIVNFSIKRKSINLCHPHLLDST